MNCKDAQLWQQPAQKENPVINKLASFADC